MRSRRLKVIILSLVAFGFLSMWLWNSLRPVSSPLEHAKSVVQTTSWLPDRGNPGVFPMYYWSGVSDLTYFGRGNDGNSHLFRRSAASTNDSLDIEGPAVNVSSGYPGQLSQNGKWFTEWHQNKLRQRVPTFISMDGKQRRIGMPTWGAEGVWTQGDRPKMIVEAWRNGSAAADVYDPSSDKVQKFAFPQLSHFHAPQRVDANGHLIGSVESSYIMNIRGVPPAPYMNYPFLKMVRIDLSHTEGKPEEWSVRVPEELENGSCLVAPAGDRLLWIVHGDLTSPALKKIRDLFPRLIPKRMGTRWILSGLHGENMYDFASYRVDITATRAAPDPFSRPRWMPDSRHISFIHRNVLYTLPVE